MKIRLAVDVTIGKKRRKELMERGYIIAYVAKAAEPDQEWLKAAHENHAVFVISADLDIPKIIEREKYPMFWVNFPIHDGFVNDYLVEYVDNAIKTKLRQIKEMAKFLGSKENEQSPS
jgi:hypothetical protein